MAGATALAAVIALVGCTSNTPAPPVSVQTDHITNCMSPSTTRPWTRLRTQPTEFAMDYLVIKGTAPVVMESVQAVGASNITVTAVTFVPGGAVGNGFPFGDIRAASFPAAWTARRTMPAAHLDPLTSHSSIVNGAWARAPQWQAVIGVLPTTSGPGYLHALRYTYTVHGHRYSLTGNDAAGIAPKMAGCPSG